MSSPPSPPEAPTLFLDRNLGKKIIPERLRPEGIQVEVHDDHLAIDAPDEEWIALVGKRNWVAITKDRNILYRTGELDSVGKHSARVVVIRMKNATGPDMADLLASARGRIARFAEEVPAPFVAGLYRNRTLRKIWPGES
ncbi:MAG: hypothetical protein OXP09_03605 [Gammaproteobacteria bacterium]|nr:hypothetical protein [Gammaproteobacteria bacterium]MDE0364637.1 hypothetical protein [Gammaproteobacteria bacterium]